MLGIEEILCELGGGGEGEGGLPAGFRFHPTDEELITFYLGSKVFTSTFSFSFSPTVQIPEVDLNRCEPWDLPEVAKMGEREWYFFSLRDRKYPTGLRTNRATGAGYWKATGKDREVYNSGSGRTLLGMKKTLVFYKGRAPHGEKTKWVMHEYRLDGDFSYRHTCKDEWVICRIFHKLGEKKGTLISKKALHEGATPLFMFGENQEDQKSLVNLPTYPCIQFETTTTPVKRQWGVSHDDINPPLPLPPLSLLPIDIEQQRHLAEMSYYFNTATTTLAVGGGVDGVTCTNDYHNDAKTISLPMGFNNHLLLPTI